MPLKFQKLDRRDFSESECFSSPHSLKHNCYGTGGGTETDEFLEKAQKEGGVIFNSKNYNLNLCTGIFGKILQNTYDNELFDTTRESWVDQFV